MCIIVAKPKGKELPSLDILRNCFTANRHGAGLMFNHNNRVYIYKGFMSWEDFSRSLKKISDKFDLEEKGVVFHFRISTGGNVDEGNCHPYPITGDETLLRKTKVITKDVAVAHNGIIHCCSGKSKLLNDTQIFVKDYINTLYLLDNKFYKNHKMMNMLEAVANSKLCFLDKLGEMHMLGEFIEDEGIFYSNTSYKSFKRYRYEPHGLLSKPFFDDIVFNLDDTIKNEEYDNLMKKCFPLEKNEYVFSNNMEEIFEGNEKNHTYVYDLDDNLFEINEKAKTASLVATDIKFDKF